MWETYHNHQSMHAPTTISNHRKITETTLSMPSFRLWQRCLDMTIARYGPRPLNCTLQEADSENWIRYTYILKNIQEIKLTCWFTISERCEVGFYITRTLNRRFEPKISKISFEPRNKSIINRRLWMNVNSRPTTLQQGTSWDQTSD